MKLSNTLVKAAVQVAFSASILAGCTYLLSQQVTAETIAQVPGLVSAVSPVAWLGAIALTFVSFWAVGRYDGIAHQLIGTGVPQGKARLSGALSIGVAQSLGLGVITGAIARWRILPDLSPLQAGALSTFVSLSFMAACVVWTALVCLFLPAPGWTFWPAIVGIGVGYATIALLFLFPKLKIHRTELRMPSLKQAGQILVWTAVDTACAAMVLFVLLPPGHGVTMFAFLPIFLLAIGVALISNTPGGMGPFELMLMTALPQIPVEALLASIVAYRMVYYAIPATIGAFFLVFPLRKSPPRAQSQGVVPDVTEAPRSEVSVVLQNGGVFVPMSRGAAAVWPTGQTISAFGDPISGPPRFMRLGLMALARSNGRIPLAYKCGARMAGHLRRYGWSVLHIADDAVLKTSEYDVDQPARRTLRRKLRAAEKSGIRIHYPPSWPWQDLARIDAEWQEVHGRARGGTMGRFSPEYVSDQWVAVAMQDDTPVAFVTFHHSRKEWCLDLMRAVKDLPDGTMHTLVHAGILAAKHAGVPKVNLAATPACPDPSSAFWRWAAQQATTFARSPGLRQFKSNFGPVWEPRYAASTWSVGLVIGLADITRQVMRPPELQFELPQDNPNETHNVDEDNELASRRRA